MQVQPESPCHLISRDACFLIACCHDSCTLLKRCLNCNLFMKLGWDQAYIPWLYMGGLVVPLWVTVDVDGVLLEVIVGSLGGRCWAGSPVRCCLLVLAWKLQYEKNLNIISQEIGHKHHGLFNTICCEGFKHQNIDYVVQFHYLVAPNLGIFLAF